MNIEIDFTQTAFSCLFDPADSPLRHVFEQLPDKDGVGIVQLIPGGTGMPLGAGIDAHWRAKHEPIMAYKEFWASLCDRHR